MTFRYTEIKRGRFGSCNICGRRSLLTWDHVPPKGGIELSAVEIRSVLQNVASQAQANSYVLSQNGLKFRTICKCCNEKFGSRYDPVLNEFAKGVGSYLKTTLSLPSIVHFRTRPVAIMRAVLGHLLSTKAHFDYAVTDQSIRSFVFDETIPIPPVVNIFYWIYPYENIAVLRNIGMPAVRGRFDRLATFDILKYFPIAYLVTDASRYEGLDELTVFRNLSVNDYAEIPINLRGAREPDWPERIDPGNFIFGGQSLTSSVYAIPRKNNEL